MIQRGRRILCLAFLALGAIALCGTGQDQPTSAPQQDEGWCLATCVLNISAPMNEPQWTAETLGALLRSGGVLDGAARDCGLSADEVNRVIVNVRLPRSVTIKSEDGQQIGTLSAVVEVSLPGMAPDGRAKLRKLLAAMCRNLEAWVHASTQPEQERLARRMLDAERTLETAETELRRIHERGEALCREAGQVSLSREALLEQTRVEERELHGLDMKLAGLTARQKALAEQIARIGKEAAQRATTDPVVAELEKLVKLRQQKEELVKVLRDQGHGTPTDLADVQESIALARAELEKQRQAASQGVSGNLLADLNKELIGVAVEIAEMEARRAFLQGQLAQVREKKLLELADQYEREVELPLSAARQAIQESRHRLAEAVRQEREFRPPTVEVLGAPEVREKPATKNAPKP